MKKRAGDILRFPNRNNEQPSISPELRKVLADINVPRFRAPADIEKKMKQNELKELFKKKKR